MKPLFAILVAVLFVCFFLGCTDNETTPSALPHAVAGVMDLRNYDFVAQGPIHLDGDWEFYPGTFLVSGKTPSQHSEHGLLRVPGHWNDFNINNHTVGRVGYGTYRLTIRLAPRSFPLALHLKNIGTSFSCYVNGEKVAQAGSVGTDKSSTRPWFKPQICRIGSGHFQDMELCVEVANFHEIHGGLWDPVALGMESDVRSRAENRQFLDFLIFGAIFFMGLYHLGLYILKSRSLSPFYFSLVCFLMSVRIVFTHERYILRLFPEFNWTLFHKIEYLTVTLTVAAFFSFIHIIFPDEFSKRCHSLIVGVSLAYSGVIIMIPPFWYAFLLGPFQLATIVFSLYTVYVIVTAIRRKRTGAGAIFIGFLVLFAAVINDILHQNQIIRTDFVAPVGIFIFLFSQAFLISMRFSEAFDTIEMLKEAAEAANNAKNQFIANMSHELRTPLNGVIGMAELIRDTSLDDIQKEYVHIIRSSSSLLLTIVSDILDLSKMESGQIYIEQLNFDLKDVVEGVYSILHPRACDKHIDFSYHVHPAIVTTVRGDADRLKQILLNIAGNAIKFTDTGSVSIHLVPEEIRDSDETISCVVRDTGIGIDSEKMESLFRPFAQVDVSMSRKYGGMGLGLAISKYLVERMGGTIEATSRVGRGSEFRFTLCFPVCQPMVETHGEPKAGKLHGDALDTLSGNTPSRILIVEDNAANRRLAEILVRKLGHASESVCDGQEAVTVLCDKTFDLILMDIQMPVMDGFQATRIIRDSDSDVLVHDVPIIAMTAHAMTGDREKCFSAGMDAYLTKPINPKHLNESIDQMLGRKQRPMTDIPC